MISDIRESKLYLDIEFPKIARAKENNTSAKLFRLSQTKRVAL